MKRKLTAAILCVSMVTGLALTGCGNSADEPKEETPKVDAETAGTLDPEEVEGEITFTAWGSDAELECDQAVLDAFAKKYPNVKVHFEPINDDYLTKVETMMLAGEAPDVIYGHPKYFQKWGSQDLLLDLTPYFENNKDFFNEDVYATNIYDAFTYDGKYVSTVNGADTFLLFYNKDLFDDAKVDYPTEE